MNLRKNLLILFVVPFFFVAFGVGYNPFDMFTVCNYGTFQAPVHIVLLGCVLMLTLLVSRAICFFVEKVVEIPWWGDIIWSFTESFVAAFFMAMYISLFNKSPYFEALGWAFQFVYAILIYPYAIILLVEALIRQIQGVKFSQAPENVIHFHDENKHVKLVVSAPAVLYIKADDNCVRINYLESGRLKEYSLRASMKSLEPIADRFHLVRCQRSYYVNPMHVKVLRKDKDGFIFADLGMEDVNPIPVSKTYYENIASIL